MVKTYRLQKIEEAVELGTTLSDNWFRGHAKVINELSPGIYRKKYDTLRKFKSNLEFSMIEHFKREAPAFMADPPPHDDHIAWLFLMQHHGAPTRLLDWSRNVLVALYFCTRNDLDEDAELWSMRSDNLNRHNGLFGKPTPINKILHFLAGQPSHQNPEVLAKDLGLESIPKYPFAVLPPFNFPRLVNQMAAFTIHPPPCNNGTIIDLLPDPKDLVRYIVPKGCKQRLRRNLESLGILEHILFPDLDALSKSIDYIAFHSFAYGPPDPPFWYEETEDSSNNSKIKPEKA